MDFRQYVISRCPPFPCFLTIFLPAVNSIVQSLSNISAFRTFFLDLPDILNNKLVSRELLIDPSPPISPTRAIGNVAFTASLPMAASSISDQFSHCDALPPPPLKLQRTSTELILADTQTKTKAPLSSLSICGEVHNILRVLWSGRWATLTPHKLVGAIWANVPQFRSFKQQDAHEFLLFLLDRLESELTQPYPNSPIQLSSFKSNFVASTFESVLSTCTTCAACGRTSHYRQPGTKYVRLQVWPTLERLRQQQETLQRQQPDRFVR